MSHWSRNKPNGYVHNFKVGAWILLCGGRWGRIKNLQIIQKAICVQKPDIQCCSSRDKLGFYGKIQVILGQCGLERLPRVILGQCGLDGLLRVLFRLNLHYIKQILASFLNSKPWKTWKKFTPLIIPFCCQLSIVRNTWGQWTCSRRNTVPVDISTSIHVIQVFGTRQDSIPAVCVQLCFESGHQFHTESIFACFADFE